MAENKRQLDSGYAMLHLGGSTGLNLGLETQYPEVLNLYTIKNKK